jgi:hypothetical protein
VRQHSAKDEGHRGFAKFAPPRSFTVSRRTSLLSSTIERAARPAEDRRVSRTYAPGAMRRLTYTESAPARPSSEENARLLALLAVRDAEISSLKKEVVSHFPLPRRH